MNILKSNEKNMFTHTSVTLFSDTSLESSFTICLASLKNREDLGGFFSLFLFFFLSFLEAPLYIVWSLESAVSFWQNSVGNQNCDTCCFDTAPWWWCVGAVSHDAPGKTPARPMIHYMLLFVSKCIVSFLKNKSEKLRCFTIIIKMENCGCPLTF